MWIFYTALSLFVLLTAYFFILPLSKKRPVLIKHGGLVAYVVVFPITLHPIWGSWSLVLAVVLAMIILLFLKAWFIYGVTGAMITDALEKAASATRASIEKIDGNYKIDNSLQVRSRNPMRRINIISFKKGGESKKAKLTVVVFKKFIQNYFV